MWPLWPLLPRLAGSHRCCREGTVGLGYVGPVKVYSTLLLIVSLQDDWKERRSAESRPAAAGRAVGRAAGRQLQMRRSRHPR